jgi:hypothetical protein
MMGSSLLHTGEVAASRPYLDRAIALYEPSAHRPLATRFGQDVRVSALSFRSLAAWLLGYPDVALKDADYAVKDAREVGQAASLMYALGIVAVTYSWCGNHTLASKLVDELTTVAEEKGAVLWRASGILMRGWILTWTGNASDAIRLISVGLAAWEETATRA